MLPYRPLGSLFACALLGALPMSAAAAQQVKMDAQGTVVTNALSSGPFAGIPAGAPVSMTFLVNTPGVDLSPGQYTNYVIHKPTFRLTVGGVSLGLGNGSPAVGIQNGFPVADGVHLFQTGLSQPGYFFEFELFDGTSGQIFDSTDVLQEAGTYGPALFQKMAWNVNQALVIGLASFTIQPAVSAGSAPYGCGLNPPGSLAVSAGAPKLGTSVTLALDNPLGTQAPGSISFLAVRAAPAAGFPCGIALGGFGMAGGGAPGEILVDVGSAGPLLVGAPWAGTGSPVSFVLAIPPDTSLYGVSIYTQGALVDPSPLADPFIGLSSGVRLRIGG